MNNIFRKTKSTKSSIKSKKESSSISSSSEYLIKIAQPEKDWLDFTKQENKMIQNTGRNSKLIKLIILSRILIQASFKVNEKMIIDMAKSNILEIPKIQI